MIEFDGEVSLIDKRLLPTESGIYFVCDGTGEILYVGKSVNLRQRWGSHHRLNKARGIESIVIKWKHIDKGNLDKMEKFYIETLLPSWNNIIDIADSKEVPIRIDREQYDQLAEIRESDGIPIAEQVRIAVSVRLQQHSGDAAVIVLDDDDKKAVWEIKKAYHIENTAAAIRVGIREWAEIRQVKDES